MRRHLFTFASALSLLLCLATLALWVRSYIVVDDVWYWTWWHGGGVMSIQGRLDCWQATALPPGGVSAATGLGWTNSMRPSGRAFLPGGPLFSSRLEMGFGIYSNARQIARQLYLPHGVVAIVLAIFPIRWLLRRWRASPPPGICTACGYNLTGNTSGVCPECGTAVLPR